MAEYQFGDDVSDIDWKASASYGLPVIRRFVRDSNLAMVVAVDTGRNMAATAPDGGPKTEIAMFAAEVVCFLARSGAAPPRPGVRFRCAGPGSRWSGGR